MPGQGSTTEAFKVCACGTSYTREAWYRLTDLGTAELGGRVLEYRICGVCLSTLSCDAERVRSEGSSSPAARKKPSTG